MAEISTKNLYPLVRLVTLRLANTMIVIAYTIKYYFKLEFPI